MKNKLLAAAASVAFIATGVAAYAQDNADKHEQQRPAAERAEPHAPAGGMRDQAAPKAAQMERHDQANPAARAEGERNEMKGQAEMNGQAEKPRAAEAPAQEQHKAAQGAEPNKAAQSEEKRPAGEQPNRAAEQNHKETPAARTGANEPERNAPRTGANETQHNATGAATNERNEPNQRTGANERDRNANARTADRTPQVRGNVHMSTEHATRVGEALRREGRVEHVNTADLRVGWRVPESIVVEPLPEDVVSIVPEYRGYDYFVDSDDEIVFVSPETHEVVGMIDYEGRAASDEQTTTRVSAARPCPTEQ